jgi:gluconolactonase
MKVISLTHCDYYTEGPAVDEEGNIYFTTLAGGKIMKVDTKGISSVWAESACPNGQRILANGDHLVCDSRLGKVIRFDASGKKIGDAASGKCGDTVIQTPNDLVVDEVAGFYFTDSVRHNGSVYFFGNDGSERVVASGLDYPNGVCLSKDKRQLFIAESYKNRILTIDLKEPGIPDGNARAFCQLPANRENPATGNLPDGILTDASDRLWVAHYGMQSVHLISSQGQLINTYDTEIPLTSNLCFVRDSGKLVVTGGRGEPGPGNVNVLVFSNNHH